MDQALKIAKQILVACEQMGSKQELRKMECITNIKSLVTSFEKDPTPGTGWALCQYLRAEDDHLEGEPAFNSTIFNADIIIDGRNTTISSLYGDLDETLRQADNQK